MNIELKIGPTIKILNIPRERFNEWRMRGFIFASKHQYQGARRVDIFVFEDLITIYLFNHLIERGLNRSEAKTISSTMTNNKKAIVDPNIHFFVYNRWQTHSNIERKEIPPAFRFLNKKDFNKTFNTIFMKFDDVEGSEHYNHDEINLLDSIVINIGLIRDRVESNCRKYFVTL